MKSKKLKIMVADVRRNIQIDDNMSDIQKKGLLSSLEQIESKLEVPNTQVHRIAVYAISIAALLLIIGSIGIVIHYDSVSNIPDFFAVTMGTTIGALAGMLVPTNSE